MKRIVPALVLSLLALSNRVQAEPTSHVEDSRDAVEGPSVHYPPASTRLWVGAIGLTMAGGGWGIAFGAGQGWPAVPGAQELKIPVVGPWIALGKSGCSSDDPHCAPETIGYRAALLVLDGLVQIGGLALVTQAILMKTEPERSSSAIGLKLPGVTLSPVPIVSSGFTGIGLTGTF